MPSNTGWRRRSDSLFIPAARPVCPRPDSSRSRSWPSKSLRRWCVLRRKIGSSSRILRESVLRVGGAGLPVAGESYAASRRNFSSRSRAGRGLDCRHGAPRPWNQARGSCGIRLPQAESPCGARRGRSMTTRYRPRPADSWRAHPEIQLIRTSRAELSFRDRRSRSRSIGSGDGPWHLLQRAGRPGCLVVYGRVECDRKILLPSSRSPRSSLRGPLHHSRSLMPLAISPWSRPATSLAGPFSSR